MSFSIIGTVANENIDFLLKDYGEKIEEPPSKKKRRDGPVRISIPLLRDLKSLAEEEGECPCRHNHFTIFISVRIRMDPSFFRQSGSGL